MTYQFIPGAADDIALITDHAALHHYSQSADPRAFEVLTLRYQSMVLATCRRVLGNTADADDAVQETFLRLARNAADVRSNVAAWLHACALRISIDQQRKQSAQRRAEEHATRTAAAQAGDDSAATWRELEPLIDDALSNLHESDRDLIVSRFLVGRSQAEMAKEAGVNPGTIHRRIDAALSRLREQLRVSGCALGAGAFVAALAHAPAPVQASTALAGSLGKIALVETTVAGSAAGVGGSTATAVGVTGTKWLAAAAIGLLLSGGTAAVMLSQPRAAQPAAQTPASAPTNAAALIAPLLGEKGSSFARPGSAIGGFALSENYSESKNYPRLYFDGPKLYFGPNAESKTSEEGVILEITAIDPSARPPTINFRGVEVGGVGGASVGDKAKGLAGRVIEATYRLEREGRTLIVTGSFGPEKRTSEHRAVRPAPGSSIDKKGDPKGNDPAIAGSWLIVNDLVLRLSQDEIVFEDRPSKYPVERYRIIEWTESEKDGGGYAKVQVMCTSFGPARGMVGKRMKMLVRKDEKDGYTFLAFDAESEKRDTWPEKFEYTPDKQMRAFVFRKE